MREFNFKMKDTLFAGLRKFPNDQRRDEALVVCHNLAPAEKGLELHEYITSMNEAADFGGLGTSEASETTRTITINVADFITDDDLQTVTVFIDEVNKGTTDVNGLITIEGVTVGNHTIKMTKAGYTGSDVDTLTNDYIMVI